MLLRNRTIAAALIIAAFLPAIAFGAVSYTRSPAGETVSGAVTVSWSFDDISDLGVEHTGNQVYYLTLDDQYNPVYPAEGECLDANTEKAGEWIVEEPVGDIVRGVMLVSFPETCESGDEPYFFEGCGTPECLAWEWVEAAAPFLLISSTTASTFLSGAADGVQTTAGTLWLIVAVALSIPLSFYALTEVILLFRNKR